MQQCWHFSIAKFRQAKNKLDGSCLKTDSEADFESTELLLISCSMSCKIYFNHTIKKTCKWKNLFGAFLNVERRFFQIFLFTSCSCLQLAKQATVRKLFSKKLGCWFSFPSLHPSILLMIVSKHITKNLWNNLT